MSKPKRTSKAASLELDLASAPPDFPMLLKTPLQAGTPLPSDFSAAIEADHLARLWSATRKLQRYRFDAFVHAGGSGMVFKVFSPDSSVPRALKIVRHKVYHKEPGTGEVATNLSPFSEGELRALERITHPNVVRLYDAIEDRKGVIAICTSYVDRPFSLDLYLSQTLEKDPDRKGKKGIHSFSPERLDRACDFLAERTIEIASALRHMHAMELYHFDVKPANILLSGTSAKPRAILADMGASVDGRRVREQLAEGKKVRVHFTWTYAHPDLQDLLHDPAGISAGGFKASAVLPPEGDLARFDLFAFGKTLQEVLAVLLQEFGERCHASYGFRFLHIVACLLLDGQNVPSADEGGDIYEVEKEGRRFVLRDGRRFMIDTALDYPAAVFKINKITTMADLADKLDRYSSNYSWNHLAPELNAWQPDVINSVAHSPAPFPARVSVLFNHPCLRRLKDEPQLGWMREVFPGATHDRWSHSLGVFSALVGFFNALLSDPELPTLRILVSEEDVLHAFLAAIVHDIGQTTFGHDLEEACSFLYSHEDAVERLLEDRRWGEPTLGDTIQRYWPKAQVSRILAILRSPTARARPDELSTLDARSRFMDGLVRDMLKGPIDADKLDYLLRDSIACGVAYGRGVDVERFLRALTVSISPDGRRLTLAYKAKGRASIASVLLARYQLFGALYWHHTYRCIQAMFVHAAASTFSDLEHGKKAFHGLTVSKEEVGELFYQRVLCGNSWEACAGQAQLRLPPAFLQSEPPAVVQAERALEFLWRFSDVSAKALIEQLAARKVYKRVFEMRLGELGRTADYSAMKAELLPIARPQKAAALQASLLNAVHNEMRERGPVTSVSEQAALKRIQELKKRPEPLVVLDFPVRGVSTESNNPTEIGDAMRKYFVMPRGQVPKDDDVFDVVRKLHEHIATVRVFAAPGLHELVIRYLNPRKIEKLVREVIPLIRTQTQ